MESLKGASTELPAEVRGKATTHVKEESRSRIDLPNIKETWDHPNFEKKRSRSQKAILGATLGIPGHSRNGSHNPMYVNENPILGATLEATLGIGWTPKFQPKFLERFCSFDARSVVSRARAAKRNNMPAVWKAGMRLHFRRASTNAGSHTNC